MYSIRHNGAVVRALSGVLLGSQLLGCQSWYLVEVPPRQFIEQRAPAVVRVTRNDGSTVVLRQPAVVGDTLYGVRGNPTATRNQADSVTVPLDAVQEIAFRRTDPGKTIGGIVVGAIVVATAGFAILAASVPAD